MSDNLPSETPLDRLALGTDNLGRSWSLDFATGSVAATGEVQTLVGDDNGTLMPGAELTTARLVRVLAEGGWRVTPEPSGLLEIETEIGTVYSFVVPNGKEVHLMRVYEWDSTEDGWENPAARREAEESLGREAFMVRFSNGEDGSQLVANYTLPTVGGVTRAQLLDTVRRFVAETARAIENTSCEEVLK